MSRSILVIGSANIDLVIHCDRMPKRGETLHGNRFQINVGGKGLNQAVAIAKLGGEVAFLGGIGNDAYGDMLRDELRKNGIEHWNVNVGDAPTGVAMITVVNGDNSIILNAGANAALTPQAVEAYADRIAQSDYCVLQLEIPLETVQKVCEIAKNSNTKIVLNPAPFAPLPSELLANIAYLIPNEHEAQGLTGVVPDSEENCRKVVKMLRQTGVPHVIVTLGERGCVYNDGEEIVFHPAQSTTVVDTTSAGDCFIGATVSRLAQQKPLADAIAFATKASAVTVSREGASVSIPFADEIE